MDKLKRFRIWPCLVGASIGILGIGFTNTILALVLTTMFLRPDFNSGSQAEFLLGNLYIQIGIGLLNVFILIFAGFITSRLAVIRPYFHSFISAVILQLGFLFISLMTASPNNIFTFFFILIAPIIFFLVGALIYSRKNVT